MYYTEVNDLSTQSHSTAEHLLSDWMREHVNYVEKSDL